MRIELTVAPEPPHQLAFKFCRRGVDGAAVAGVGNLASFAVGILRLRGFGRERPNSLRSEAVTFSPGSHFYCHADRREWIVQLRKLKVPPLRLLRCAAVGMTDRGRESTSLALRKITSSGDAALLFISSPNTWILRRSPALRAGLASSG